MITGAIKNLHVDLQVIFVNVIKVVIKHFERM